jgi:hypothetical protein
VDLWNDTTLTADFQCLLKTTLTDAGIYKARQTLKGVVKGEKCGVRGSKPRHNFKKFDAGGTGFLKLRESAATKTLLSSEQ